MRSYSAIVLAGGRATRLGGINKALLEIGGRRLLDRVLDALRPLADQIVVVGHLANGLQQPEVEIVPDASPGGSALVAVYSGLLAVHHERALVVGCDMPFLSTTLLRYVAQLSEGHDVAVPRVRGHLEALHAAYSRSCIPVMKRAIDRQQFKIIDFYPQVRVREVQEAEVRTVDPELRSFFNINTPSDLAEARYLVSHH